MNFRDTLKLIFVAVGSMIANRCYPILTAYGFNMWESLALSSLAAVAVFYLLQLLLRIALRAQWIRKTIDPRAKYEGIYVETIRRPHSGNAYSVVCIRYDYFSDKYAVSGEAYTHNGIHLSNWKSIAPSIDHTVQEITFLHDGIKNNGERIIGHTCYRFNDDLEKGSGYFVDSGNHVSQCLFRLEKLPKSRIQDLIGATKIHDCAAFIPLYHDRFGRHIIFESSPQPGKVEPVEA